MPQTTLTFIGTDSCVPHPGDDTASFILNDHILVDCGWNAAINMTRFLRPCPWPRQVRQRADPGRDFTVLSGNISCVAPDVDLPGSPTSRR